MGKSLIIKGADFSSVSIGVPISPEQPGSITQANLTEAYAFYTKNNTNSTASGRLYFIMDISDGCTVSIKNTSSILRAAIQLRPYTADEMASVLRPGTPTAPISTYAPLPSVVYDTGWLWADGNKTAESLSMEDYPTAKAIVIAVAIPLDSGSPITFPSFSDILNNVELNITGATQIIR